MLIEERIEMNELIRHFNLCGEPQNAAPIKEALALDEYYMGEDPEPEPEPVVAPNGNATKAAWLKFAKEVSEVDHEVLDSFSKGDIIQMMKATGILKPDKPKGKPGVDEPETDD